MKQLMVVDDHPDILEVVAMIFEPEGWTVTRARDGEECLENLRHGFEGVLLLDLMMPRMDGWQTLRQLKSEGMQRQVRVVILTALDEIPPVDCHDLVQALFNKPFNLKALQAAVFDAAAAPA